MYQKKPVPPADTTAPVLSGVDDVTVEQDSEFEPLAGVSATDDVDGDVTDAVKVSGSVDAAKPGEYVLTKTEVPHGQHGGRQNQHGLSATGASRSAGWSCCWPSLAAWHSSAGGVVDGLVNGWPL